MRRAVCRAVLAAQGQVYSYFSSRIFICLLKKSIPEDPTQMIIYQLYSIMFCNCFFFPLRKGEDETCFRLFKKKKIPVKS